MIKKVENLKDEQVLYEYFKEISDVPYYFSDVGFDSWRESMFSDTDNGVPRFDELETYLLYEDNILEGFIQHGIAIYRDENSAPNYHPLIRNMHYAKHSKNPEQLIEKAFDYFKSKNMQKITAYFQCFGMSCYARQGKLHESQFYIEDLLTKYSFTPNEWNDYFSKDLSGCSISKDSEIICEIFDESSKGMGIKFFFNGEQAGWCGLSFLANGISYLGYLETFEKYRGQGLGKRCMNNVFYILKEKNFKRIDTDTYTASDFYKKIGFDYKGIMRSYTNYTE